MTKNQQKFMARKALPIFAYSWLFLAIFGLFANSFIYSYLFANIHKSAVLFAPFFFAFFGLFLAIFLCSTCVRGSRSSQLSLQMTFISHREFSPLCLFD